MFGTLGAIDMRMLRAIVTMENQYDSVLKRPSCRLTLLMELGVTGEVRLLSQESCQARPKSVLDRFGNLLEWFEIRVGIAPRSILDRFGIILQPRCYHL